MLLFTLFFPWYKLFIMILIPLTESRTYLLNSKPDRKISVIGEVQGETLNTQCINRNLEAVDLFFTNELRYLGNKKQILIEKHA